MLWKKFASLLKRWTKPSQGADQLPDIPWVKAADNPWGIPVLDVRQVTQHFQCVTADPKCAANAVSFGAEDGTVFIAAMPENDRTVRTSLRFRTDGFLANGVLFNPRAMEEKWALYYHNGQILCVRSWQRRVVAVAEVRQDGQDVEIHAIHGSLTENEVAPSYTERVLDYLLRSHCLNDVYPAPLPLDFDKDLEKAALWCHALFGNRALYATSQELTRAMPEKPLRTFSLLHIAVARRDMVAAVAELAKGVSIGLLAPDGNAPMHWTLYREDLAATKFLLEHGADVDVRSAAGVTALMDAASQESKNHAAFLLDHGADPNAVDLRGFTALHRAAQSNRIETVRLLLDRGAAPHPQASGHTPRSIAASRGHQDIVRLLDSH